MTSAAVDTAPRSIENVSAYHVDDRRLAFPFQSQVARGTPAEPANSISSSTTNTPVSRMVGTAPDEMSDGGIVMATNHRLGAAEALCMLNPRGDIGYAEHLEQLRFPAAGWSMVDGVAGDAGPILRPRGISWAESAADSYVVGGDSASGRRRPRDYAFSSGDGWSDVEDAADIECGSFDLTLSDAQEPVVGVEPTQKPMIQSDAVMAEQMMPIEIEMWKSEGKEVCQHEATCVRRVTEESWARVDHVTSQHKQVGRDEFLGA